MFKNVPTLQKLVQQLRHIPYLASKNIYRVAIHFLKNDQEKVEQFCQILLEAKRRVYPCITCFNWTESNQLCEICIQQNRKGSIICVVETWHDLMAIERAGGYQGVYHVLGGALYPLEGVGPDDLTIEALLERIRNNEVQEIIFATNPTPEGEATASYISSKLEKNTVVISKLASGVPTGSSLEYMDRVTIYKALSGRRPF